MNNDNSVVKAEHLCFEYSCGHTVIKDISFEIERGSFVCFTGSNGSGKSTLLKLLSSVLKPTSGKLEVFEKYSSLVFQNPDNQFVSNIVEEDVAFGPENLCIESSKIREIVSSSLNSVDMANTEKRSISSFSGGQKQRISIAGALAMSGSLLILDEITSMLDYSGRKAVMNIIKKLNKEDKVTVIMATQSMEEAFSSDRIIILDQNTIALDMKPQEIIEKNIDISKYYLEIPKKLLLLQYLKQQKIEDVEELKNLC